MPANPPADLLTLLRERALVADGAGFLPLHGGRTNRVWRIPGGNAVVKLYRRPDRNPLFANTPEAEVACLRALDGFDLAPRLIASGRCSDGDWVLYDHAPGQPWQRDPRPAASVLRQVHDIPPPADLVAGCDGSDDLGDQTDAILARCTGPDATALAACRPASHVARGGLDALVHRDPVAGNILVAHGRAVLIDWQCPARGDPCEDIAMFLSPAMQRLYRGSPLAYEEIAEFESAYDSGGTLDRYRALKPWYHWRMAAYCLWRGQRGDADYADAMALEIAEMAG